MINPSDVLDLITEERVKQDVEHGSLEAHGHTVPEWYVIIEVLIRKAAREWYDKKQVGAGGQTKRLVQIAAVATAALQQHGEAALRVYKQQRTLHPAQASEHGALLQTDFLSSEARDLFVELRSHDASNAPTFDRAKWDRLEATLIRLGAL